MPTKAINPKNPQLRIMPRKRPDNIERDVYRETQNALLNFYNMIESMLNKHAHSICTEIRPENITDITKLANALSALGRTAVEVERWEFEKTHKMGEVREALEEDIRRQLADYPEVQAQVLKIIKDNGPLPDITMSAYFDPRVMLATPKKETD